MIRRGRERDMVARACALVRDEAGQGTTEYAILVGVLVVTRVQLRQRLAKREVRSLFCGSPPSNERPSTYEFHRTDT